MSKRKEPEDLIINDRKIRDALYEPPKQKPKSKGNKRRRRMEKMWKYREGGYGPVDKKKVPKFRKHRKT